MKVFTAAAAVLMFCVVAIALPLTAQAQTVWRCGADGRSYSATPCPGGRPVKAADPRTATELQAAREEIKRSQDLGARMRKERLGDEKRNRAANALAANLGPEKIKPPKVKAETKAKAKAKTHHRHQPTTAEGDGTLRAAAAPFRRKQD